MTRPLAALSLALLPVLAVPAPGRAAVLPHAGQAVTLDVTEIGGDSDFDSSITGVSGLALAPPLFESALAVRLTRAGLEVAYRGEKPLLFRSRHLAVLFRRRGPGGRVRGPAAIPLRNKAEGRLARGRVRGLCHLRRRELFRPPRRT